MSKEFGYIGKEVTQAFRSNKGVLTPTDVYDLTIEDKYTNLGQLKLIQTQTYSDVAAVDFQSADIVNYNIHFLTFTGYTASANHYFAFQLYENSVLNTGSNYAESRKMYNGTNTYRTTTFTTISHASGSTDNNREVGGNVLFTNFIDTTKYVYSHGISYGQIDGGGKGGETFGASFTQTSYVNGIRLKSDSGSNITGIASLYGVKFYD